VSVYCLETHPGTPLAGLIEAGGLTLPGEDDAFAMANAALAMLTEAGLPWYEIAGFAKPGAECRHNLNYWRNGSYLGLGAAAHSHIGAQRWSNLEHPETYLAAVAGGRFPVAAAEEIGPREDLLETVMLGIRLK
jgi:oxygen-independent coproporphyrinogen-3 oxidase